MDHGQGVEVTGTQPSLHLCRIVHRALLHPVDLHLPSAPGHDLGEAAGESAVHQAERPARHPAADRRLHHASGRAGGRHDGAVGSEEAAEAGLRLAKKCLHSPPPMSDHRPRHGGQDIGVHLGGARQEEPAVPAHPTVSPRRASPRASSSPRRSRRRRARSSTEVAMTRRGARLRLPIRWSAPATTASRLSTPP